MTMLLKLRPRGERDTLRLHYSIHQQNLRYTRSSSITRDPGLHDGALTLLLFLVIGIKVVDDHTRDLPKDQPIYSHQGLSQVSPRDVQEATI